jgi:hypothetical protein
LFVTEKVILKDDVVEANPFNLPAIDEPALAGTVKRKWRERLRSRGIRLVLTPALDRPRRKQPCENIEKSDLQDEAEALGMMPCLQTQPA